LCVSGSAASLLSFAVFIFQLRRISSQLRCIYFSATPHLFSASLHLFFSYAASLLSFAVFIFQLRRISFQLCLICFQLRRLLFLPPNPSGDDGRPDGRC